MGEIKRKIKGKGKLKNGNPPGVGHGGWRPGAGRKPDWFKAQCLAELKKSKVPSFLGKIVRGEDMEQVVTEQGECLKVPASVKNRLDASTKLKEWAVGKEADKHELQDMDGQVLGLVILPAQDKGESGKVE